MLTFICQKKETVNDMFKLSHMGLKDVCRQTVPMLRFFCLKLAMQKGRDLQRHWGHNKAN